MEHAPITTDASPKLDKHYDKGHIIKTHITHVLEEVNKRLNFRIDNDDIFLLDNILTKDECSNLISFATYHGYGTTGFSSNYRGYLRLMTDDHSLAEKLWERIKDHIPKTVTDKDGSVWKADGLNVRFRWARYPVGSQFAKHCDTYYKESNTRKSFYTVNIYLNDDFDNGRTRLFENDLPYTEPYYQVNPVCGRALIFIQPENKYLIHDGETVLNNEKYLMRTDVVFKKID